jgi:hypothetical protein
MDAFIVNILDIISFGLQVGQNNKLLVGHYIGSTPNNDGSVIEIDVWEWKFSSIPHTCPRL